MKKILLLISCSIFLMPSISAQNTNDIKRKERKKAKKEAKANEVKSLINNKNYMFTAQQAIPMSGPAISLTSDYELVITPDSAIAYLPYFGVAYQVDYLERDGGIKFKEPISSYESIINKGITNIEFLVNSPKDQYNCLLSISGPGYATLSISCNKKQSIQYSGVIQKPDQ